MRRPLSGALLGIVIGLAVAVILQQLGVWPLDKLTVFLLPGLVGLIGMLITSLGREGSIATMTIALIITVPMVAWGATGFALLNQTGEINGGCRVVAASDVDTTNVTDTSRGDPFVIDPAGGLTWMASSPTVFDDYPWEIWTSIGENIRIPLDSEEMQDNDGGSQLNEGDVDDITQYASERGINIDEIRGVFIVGGEAADTCDGFGFVRLTSDPFETLISQIAAGVGLLALIGLLIVALTGRGAEAAAAGSTMVDSGTGADASSIAGGAAAGAGLGAAGEADEEEDEGPEDDRDQPNA